LQEEVAFVNKACKEYSEELNKQMMKNFEIPGVVNNREFNTDADAAKEKQYYNLTTWLTTNDTEYRSELELLTRKIFKMMQEDQRLQQVINTESSKFIKIEEKIKATNGLIGVNKKEIEDKSNRLFRKIEKGDSVLDDNIKDVTKLIWTHKKNAA